MRIRRLSRDDYVEVIFPLAIGSADLDALVFGAGLVHRIDIGQEFVGKHFGLGDIGGLFHDDKIAAIFLKMNFIVIHGRLFFMCFLLKIPGLPVCWGFWVAGWVGRTPNVEAVLQLFARDIFGQAGTVLELV